MFKEEIYMLQIREIITKEFVYSSKEEQEKHIEEMKKDNWVPSHQVSKNFGSVYDKDDSNRKLFTSFQKIPLGYDYSEQEKLFRVYKLNDDNKYEEIPRLD
jgi:hypothetical protein